MEVNYNYNGNHSLNTFNIDENVFWVECDKDKVIAHKAVVLEVNIKQRKSKSRFDPQFDEVKTRVYYKIEDLATKTEYEISHKDLYSSIDDYVGRMKEQIEFQLKVQ